MNGTTVLGIALMLLGLWLATRIDTTRERRHYSRLRRDRGRR